MIMLKRLFFCTKLKILYDLSINFICSCFRSLVILFFFYSFNLTLSYLTDLIILLYCYSLIITGLTTDCV